MTARLLIGDVNERIKEIPDGTVDLVCSSPPFAALRKYGDDPREMGSEANPAAFIDALLELCAEFRRVLTPHGSIAGLTIGTNSNRTRSAETIGWTDCGHNAWRQGHVLDPFLRKWDNDLGVAQGCGRSATGIELYESEPVGDQIGVQRHSMASAQTYWIWR